MTSPYSFESQTHDAAIHAEVTERARFLHRTYSTMFAGILVLCASLWGFSHLPAMQGIGVALMRNPIIYILLFIGIQIGVRAVARTWPINLLAFGLYAVFFGLLLSPIVTYAAATNPGVINQAVLVTALIFGGLTAYVFISGKDFSFLGGVLTTMFIALLVIGLAGWLFGFHLGLLYTGAVAIFYSLYILYDTSNVLHHYRTDEYVAAAIELFTDVVLLFKTILMMFLQRDE